MDTPLRTYYAQTVLGAGQLTGPFARAELGLHPWQNVSLFGEGGFEHATGWSAGAGLRVEF